MLCYITEFVVSKAAHVEEIGRKGVDQMWMKELEK